MVHFYEVVAKTAEEQLRRWDEGSIIWSISMGGLGPSYEQAIQVLAIEIVRDELAKPVPEEIPKNWGDGTINRIDEACGGLTGAQVGAAKVIAYQWLKLGPWAFLEKFDRERKIQVSNFWPHVPKTPWLIKNNKIEDNQ